LPALLAALLRRTPPGLARFLGVGVVGLAVNLGLLWALERAGLPMAAALAISLVAATLVTWALNRIHTFAATGRAAHHEGVRYFAVAGVAQSISWGCAVGLADLLPHLPHGVDAFAGAVVATLFSYTGHRFFTFAPADAEASAAARAVD
jgi:putative flippase GtrA